MNRLTDPAVIIVAVMLVALAAIVALPGCATMQTVAGARVDEAITQGEQAVSVARAALELYEQTARLAGKTEIEIATVRDIWAHRISVMEAALADLRTARDQWRPSAR